MQTPGVVLTALFPQTTLKKCQKKTRKTGDGAAALVNNTDDNTSRHLCPEVVEDDGRGGVDGAGSRDHTGAGDEDSLAGQICDQARGTRCTPHPNPTGQLGDTPAWPILP